MHYRNLCFVTAINMLKIKNNVTSPISMKNSNWSCYSNFAKRILVIVDYLDNSLVNRIGDSGIKIKVVVLLLL